MIGQTETVGALTGALNDGALPHAILLHGQRGTGKTSIARILRRALHCGDADYFEVNAASSRGIDTIRDIDSAAPLAPMFGRARLWVLDEFHMSTRDAMTATLKMLGPLVLLELVSRRGIAATVVIGVQAGPDFKAHAWLETNGMPLLWAGGPEYERLLEL